MITLRDPIHGFIHADPLEAALIDSRPLQRLRSIRQLGLTYLVFPGAEHSHFGNALGAMELAGKLFDRCVLSMPEMLDAESRSYYRRLVRTIALLREIGCTPFDAMEIRTAKEESWRRRVIQQVLQTNEVENIFSRWGNDITPSTVASLLSESHFISEMDALVTEITSGALSGRRLDYLLRDSLYCGVHYGVYDLARLLETVISVRDPGSDRWVVGLSEEGQHALEALAMAHYYMFSQVYFNENVVGFMLHLRRWLREAPLHWSLDVGEFLEQDDLFVLLILRDSINRHAQAILRRDRYPVLLAIDSDSLPQGLSFEQIAEELWGRFGQSDLLISISSNDSRRPQEEAILVRQYSDELKPLAEISPFVSEFSRANLCRLYGPQKLRADVLRALKALGLNVSDSPKLALRDS